MFEYKVQVGPGELTFNARSLEEIYLLLNKLGTLGDKELFDKMEAIDRLNIPAVCPVDGMPVKLQMREAKSGDGRKFIAYEVMSTGVHRFRMALGVFTDPKPNEELFVKEQEGWVYWDAERKEARTVWQYGRIIYDNLPDGFEVPAEQAALYPAGNYVPKGESQQSSAPRQQQPSQRTQAGSAPSSIDEGAVRKAKAQTYLLGLAEQAGIPKAQAYKAFATHFMDDGIVGNASLGVEHAEQAYNAIKQGGEADFVAVLQAAHEFGQEQFVPENDLPF